MAKEGKTEINDDHKKTKAENEKVETAIEQRVENSPDPKKAVNIIGDIAKPDPTDKDEVKAYFKKIDEKLDKLLGGKEEPKKDLKETEIPPPTPAPVPWYDREYI